MIDQETAANGAVEASSRSGPRPRLEAGELLTLDPPLEKLARDGA